MNRVEALTEALIKYTRYSEPESSEYKFRNPLGLRWYPTASDHDHDEATGLRIFGSLVDGYQAALFDVKLKVAGKSRAGLKGNDTLIDLCRSYSMPDGTAAYVAKFLRKALGMDHLNERTHLEYFAENSHARSAG